MADATAIHLSYLQAVNAHDLTAIRSLFDPDYTYLGADGVEHHGPDAGVAQVEGFLTAFPDLRIDLDHQHSCGDVSVLEGTLHGTHQADMGPIPATGKTIELKLCDVVEVRDGKVRREREYIDQMTMMQQLGVAPTS